jgi:hypothetical protein
MDTKLANTMSSTSSIILALVVYITTYIGNVFMGFLILLPFLSLLILSCCHNFPKKKCCHHQMTLWSVKGYGEGNWRGKRSGQENSSAMIFLICAHTWDGDETNARK